MAHLNFLEQFESKKGAVPFSPPLQDLPGYDAGYEAGLADAARQKGQLSAALVDRLTEMQFGYAEAQHMMMNALAPFIRALVHQILPGLTDDLTRAHLAEALLSAARAKVSDPITLTFHPETASVVRLVLADIADVEVQLHEDATLGKQEIYIGTRYDETQLDVASLITSIQTALSSIATSQHGGGKHG